jgi:uncharacterized protein YjdB
MHEPIRIVRRHGSTRRDTCRRAFAVIRHGIRVAGFAGLAISAIAVAPSPALAQALIRIEVAPTERVIEIGETKSMSAFGTFVGGRRLEITDSVLWSSSDPRVAVVEPNRGQVTGVGPGTAAIRATDPVGRISSSDSGSDGIVFVPAGLVSISVAPREIELPAGFVRVLEARGRYSDGVEADVSNKVTWISSDASVVSVSNNPGHQGEITTRRPGTETIIAIDPISGTTSTDSAGDAVVTVLAAMEAIIITPEAAELSVGLSQRFSARARLADDTLFTLSRATLLWTSHDPRVAAVSNLAESAGLVTARAPGTTTISATHLDSGMQSSSNAVATVLDRLLRITVLPADRRIKVGEAKSMTAIGHYADGQEREITDQVTWAASDRRIATVSNEGGFRGRVTGVRSGATTISATFSTGLTSSASDGDARVRVVAELESLRNDPAEVTVPVGFTVVLDAIGGFADDTTDDISSDVEWSSSNSDVAVVSNAPGSEGEVTAIGPGSAVIRSIDPASQISSTNSGGDTVVSVAGSITELFVTPEEELMEVGQSRRFSARARLDDDSIFTLTRQSVRWTSSNPGVATVGNDPEDAGLVEAIALGETFIGAFHEPTGLIAVEAKLGVRGDIVALRVAPKDRSLDVGEVKSMTALATFSDGAEGEVTDAVQWTTSNPAVATISNEGGENGRVTGVGAGVAIISARAANGIGSADGGKDGRVRVRGRLASLKILPNDPVLAVGFTTPLDADGTFENGGVDDVSSDVTWSTSNPAVVTVSNDRPTAGEITAIGDGTAVISVRDASSETSGVSSTTTGGDAIVTVSGRVARLLVTPATVDLPIGLARRLTPRAERDDGQSFSIARHTVEWRSANPAVATVSNAESTVGTVTALATGRTTVGIAHLPSGLSSTDSEGDATVIVPGSLVAVEVTPREQGLFVGTTQRLGAIGRLANGRTLKLSSGITFASSDPVIAAVDNASGRRGDTTGLSPGVTYVGVTHQPSGLSSGDADGDAAVLVAAAPQGLRVQVGRTTLRTGNVTRLRAFGRAASPVVGAGLPQVIEVEVTDHVEWTSSDPSVARIVDREIQAIGTGTAILSARDPITGLSSATAGGNAVVRVVAALRRLKVSPKKIRTRLGARPVGLRVIGVYSDRERLDITNDIEFLSSDPTVATISSEPNRTGEIVPLRRGRTKVTIVEPITGSTVERAARIVIQGAARRPQKK